MMIKTDTTRSKILVVKTKKFDRLLINNMVVRVNKLDLDRPLSFNQGNGDIVKRSFLGDSSMLGTINIDLNIVTTLRKRDSFNRKFKINRGGDLVMISRTLDFDFSPNHFVRRD